MVRFVRRVQYLLADRGEVLNDLTCKVGVTRSTMYRGPKFKQTIAAVAYYLGVDADELVKGTDAEEVWNKCTGGY